ncbi:MAG: c-type cytochrome [Nitrospirota bacterium]
MKEKSRIIRPVLIIGSLLLLLMAVPYVSMLEVAEGAPSIDRGDKLFHSEDVECNNCHKLDGKGGSKKKKEPNLSNIGSHLTAEQIKAKIMDPCNFMATGFKDAYEEEVMPTNFAELLSEEDIESIAAFLATRKDTSVNTPKPIPQSDC